jgi:CheY-like chemotaxis protein
LADTKRFMLVASVRRTLHAKSGANRSGRQRETIEVLGLRGSSSIILCALSYKTVRPFRKTPIANLHRRLCFDCASLRNWRLLRHDVLIAEDEEFIRIIVVEYLIDAGFHVLEAVHAAHALAVINEADLDLVFTDIHMPGEMDGHALADWLHQHRPNVPVLLTSGVDQPAIGASGKHRRFIPKPYALPEVERHIRELLR